MVDVARGDDRERDVVKPSASRLRLVWRASVLLVALAVGFFYLMIAAGAASFIQECDGLVCAQLHQALFAAIGAVALFVAAFRILDGSPSAAKIAFFGTIPLLVVHVILVIEDPNESMFFPLSTAPPPVFSAAALLLQRRSTTR